jgi:hypothetical protein
MCKHITKLHGAKSALTSQQTFSRLYEIQWSITYWWETRHWSLLWSKRSSRTPSFLRKTQIHIKLYIKVRLKPKAAATKVYSSLPLWMLIDEVPETVKAHSWSNEILLYKEVSYSEFSFVCRQELERCQCPELILFRSPTFKFDNRSRITLVAFVSEIRRIDYIIRINTLSAGYKIT